MFLACGQPGLIHSFKNQSWVFLQQHTILIYKCDFLEAMLSCVVNDLNSWLGIPS